MFITKINFWKLSQTNVSTLFPAWRSPCLHVFPPSTLVWATRVSCDPIGKYRDKKYKKKNGGRTSVARRRINMGRPSITGL